MAKLNGAPCYQHDSYHPECSDCYHPLTDAEEKAKAKREERLGRAWDDLGRTLREMGEEEPGW